jgi:hypothetical protein
MLLTKIGFQVKYAAIKVQVNKFMEIFMRWKYPHKYYRLTGHDCFLKIFQQFNCII